MPLITRITDDGVEHAATDLAQTRRWLSLLGLQCGRLMAPRAATGVMPRLAHAAELLALERRFGGTQWVRGRAADRPHEATLHQHDEPERLVVLGGQVVLLMHAPALGGWLRLALAERDWVVLPAALAHQRIDGGRGVELLRRVHDRGGLRVKPVGVPAVVPDRVPDRVPDPLPSPWHTQPATLLQTQMPPAQQLMRSASLVAVPALPRVAA